MTTLGLRLALSDDNGERSPKRDKSYALWPATENSLQKRVGQGAGASPDGRLRNDRDSHHGAGLEQTLGKGDAVGEFLPYVPHNFSLLCVLTLLGAK